MKAETKKAIGVVGAVAVVMVGVIGAGLFLAWLGGGGAGQTAQKVAGQAQTGLSGI